MRRYALALFVVSVAPAADFVGNRACAECHAAIYRSYMRTPMAQSSGKVSSGNETFDKSEFRDTRGAFAYKVTPDYRLEYTQQRVAQPITGVRSLAYFIGSGAAARTFLTDEAGFLFESPATYYRQSAS